MSESIPKSSRPQDYGPKKTPEILSLAAESVWQNATLPSNYMLDAVFPTGDNPWAGGSDFLRCFASLYMHLEGMPPSGDTRYWLYRKFLAVTGMGMVTTFIDRTDANNYSFEAANDYLGRLHRFVGYRYAEIRVREQKKSALFHTVARSIYEGRPVLAVFKIGEKTHAFNRKWRIFVGYDAENQKISYNENGTAFQADWFESLDRIFILTQTGLPRPDMKDVLVEIIEDAERSESQGEQYGYAAYEGLIARRVASLWEPCSKPT